MTDNILARDPALASRAEPVATWRVKWRYAGVIVLIHGVAALAFMPRFFSWTGVTLAVLGYFLIGTVGINIGYHRLLTHRGFSCPLWFERVLALLGVCCFEDSPTVWVAKHRQHHHASDRELDPHSPLASFLWGHIGWLLVKGDEAALGLLMFRYAQELTRDPFYRWLVRRDNWFKIALASWAMYFIVGFAAESLVRGSSTLDAVEFGASLLIWGAAVRTVLVWHATWSVNSVSHLWGYRNYETLDNSRNNLLVGLVSCGEGWHNNHHADPSAARHGDNWREPDLSWQMILGLKRLGLVKNVVYSSRRRTKASKSSADISS